MSKEKQIELLEKQLAFWKHHSTQLAEELDRAEKIANRYTEMLDETEEELNAERVKHEWISVEDRLPEANTQVLAINSDGEFYVATYLEHKISPSARGYMTWACGMYNGKPTHWMPLPEPPKMRKEDEGK